MSDKFREEGVGRKVLSNLEKVGWETYGNPEQDVWGASELDERYGRDPSEVVYWSLLKDKLVELNAFLTPLDASDVIEKLRRRIDAEQLVEGNRDFYRLLRNGVKHTPEEGEEAEYVNLVDWGEDVPPERRGEAFRERNSLIAATEFTVQRSNRIRPDLVLFLNGIPIVPMELKSTAEESTVEDGIREMKAYEEAEPRLFVPALFNAVCNGEKFRYAAVGAPRSFYFPWRSEDWRDLKESDEYYEPADAVSDLLAPDTLRDILRYFVFYEETDSKIVPRYMQYRAANRILQRIRDGEPRRGLIWHTQGSGKSYTMLFAAHKAKRLPDVPDAQYVLIVDRKKLNEQMKDTLHSIDFPSFATADTIEHLEELLAEEKAQLILTTIHKFSDTDEDLNADISFPTVVMVDEAHRFMEKKLGNRLRSALSGDYFYFGFTGTPVKEGTSAKDRNTFREFSPEGEGYLHRYSIREGQADHVITRVTFTRATVDWNITEQAMEEMDLAFDRAFEDLDPDEKQEVLETYVNRTELVELKPRLRKVVRDIQTHFRKRVEPNGFKGMVVTPSKRAAALYGDELETYFNPDEIGVVVSVSGTDPEIVQNRHRSPGEERTLIKNFRDPDQNPKLLVVCDKLLTGFDAPVLKTMYLDKSLRNHNLLQAIARTNRPMEGKENGEIVDYQGVFDDIEEALEYEDFVIEEVAVSTDELVDEFKKHLETLMEMFSELTFSGDPEQFQRAIVKLEKNTSFAMNFENTYERAENLWETVAPHSELGTEDIEQRWSIISQIHARYKRTERGGHGSLREDVRAKTRTLLEDHIDIDEVQREESITYEIPERGTEGVVSDSPAEYGFILRAINMKDQLEVAREQNPAYESLSERVRKVIQSWRNDDITVTECKQQLNEIEDEQEDLKQERERRELSEEAHAVYRLLLEDYSDHVDDEDEARDIAHALSEATKETTVTGNLSEVKRRLEASVITTLADRGNVNLCKGDNRQFVTESVNYLIENRREQDADD